ncbi:MAG: hypothetical protein JW737_06205 [Acidobacteria bacterium]|nr:hypothetical protein [Acidobacteriota bacterium]
MIFSNRNILISISIILILIIPQSTLCKDKVAGIEIKPLMKGKNLSFTMVMDWAKYMKTDMYDISVDMFEYAIQGLDRSDQQYVREAINVVTKALREMNLDIKKDIKGVLMHFSITTDKFDLLGYMILEGKLNEEKIVTWFEKTTGVKFLTKKKDNYKIYYVEDTMEAVNFTFDSKGNLILAFGMDALKPLLSLKGKTSVPTPRDQRFDRIWKELDKDVIVWGIGYISESIMSKVRESQHTAMFANLLYCDYMVFTDNYDGTNQETRFDIYVSNPKKRTPMYNIFYGYYMLSKSMYSNDPYMDKMSKLTKISENPEKNTVYYHLKYPIKKHLSDMNNYMRKIVVEAVREIKQRIFEGKEYYGKTGGDKSTDPFIQKEK